MWANASHVSIILGSLGNLSKTENIIYLDIDMCNVSFVGNTKNLFSV